MKKTVEVPPELWQYLKRRAKRNGRTVYGELGVILDTLRMRDKHETTPT